jgi:hypothetical protein
MPRSELPGLADSYPPVAEDFVQRPFRSRNFQTVTASFLVIILGIIFLDFKEPYRSSFEMLGGSLAAVFLLAWAWWQTLKIYTSIRTLFYNGQIAKFEKDSALDKVLVNTSNLMTVYTWVIGGAILAMAAMIPACAHRPH